MSLSFRVLSLLALMAVVGLGACASGPDSRARVSYRVSAKENFIKGKKALEDEDYLEAIEYFKFVKNKFPYSSYATESDLLLADAHFAREHYIEAADAYQTFIKLHPRHPKVPYANFRIALSFNERIPDDWFFMPPAFEFDQKEVVRTIRELEHFLARYPQDEHVKQAQDILKRCKKRLAEFSHYAMEFNYKGGHYRGVIWRADEILGRYRGSGFDEIALFRKAESLAKLGEPQGAREVLVELKARFPEGRFAADARKLQDQLGLVQQKPAPAKTAPGKPAAKDEPQKDKSDSKDGKADRAKGGDGS